MSLSQAANATVAETGGEQQPPRGNRDRGPRQRGGRGRRRWREGDERAPRRDNRDQPQTEWNDNTAPAAEPDGNTLPAFTRQEPIQPPPPRAPEPVVVNATLESTPRDPNAPSKKGWWQKMIELDD